VLGRIENPSISGDTMETMARAIDNRDVRGTVLTTYVGPIGNRDTLAQAAEILLGMDEVTTVLVFGRHEETVYLSARARGAEIDLGETVRLAYGQIGSAGGHADMAGAQIPLRSILALPADGEEDVDDVVEDVVVERFLETIESRPASLTGRFDTGVDEGIVSSEPHGTLFGSRGDEE
jgi:nanoRNase/pAp phosphatase (c-di-AMP/oligoRNAs hydrolase)